MSIKHLERIQEILEARLDAVPELMVAGRCFRRFGSRLYLLPLPPAAPPAPQVWDAQAPLRFADGSCLTLLEGQPDTFEIRFRSGGERCQPLERQHSQTLKKLLQEYQLEPWWRDLVPLVYRHGELCAVGDLFVCAAGRDYRFEWVLPQIQVSPKLGVHPHL